MDKLRTSITRRSALAGSAAIAAGMALPGWAAERPVQVIGRVRQLDPALDDVIAADAKVVQVAQGFTWCEGPLWVESRHELLFSDVPENTMYRWSPKGGLGMQLKPSGWNGAPDPALREAGSNGLAIDRLGRVVIADSGTRALSRLDLKTMKKTILVDHYQGKRFNSPNDAIVADDDSIYFTDPPYGLKDGDKSPVKELTFQGVYRWAPDGSVTLLDDTLSLPNGVGLSPDQRTLYVSVSDPAAPRVYAYDLDKTGRAANRRVFFDAMPLMGEGVKGLPDGLTVDAHGRVFVAGPGGLLILSPAGKLLGVIEANDRPISNCVFDGKHTLYMTCGDIVASVRVKTRGL